MPKLKMKADNLTAEQIDELNDFLSRTTGNSTIRIKPDFSKETIEELGWEFSKKNELGTMYFELGVYDLIMDADGLLSIEEGMMEVRFKGKIKSKKQLKTIMKAIGIKKAYVVA